MLFLKKIEWVIVKYEIKKYVIDKSEDDRKSLTINTLEKLDESVEGVLYKSHHVEQVF